MPFLSDWVFGHTIRESREVYAYTDGHYPTETTTSVHQGGCSPGRNLNLSPFFFGLFLQIRVSILGQVTDTVFHPPSKHIEVRHHWVREKNRAWCRHAPYDRLSCGHLYETLEL